VSEPVTKVSIDTPPLSITVEHHHAKLDEVVKVALDLYREVYTADMARPGSGVGFTAERTAGDVFDQREDVGFT
jgi:hypothetical protein